MYMYNKFARQIIVLRQSQTRYVCFSRSDVLTARDYHVHTYSAKREHFTKLFCAYQNR